MNHKQMDIVKGDEGKENLKIQTITCASCGATEEVLTAEPILGALCPACR